jgi:hypothetical protein
MVLTNSALLLLEHFSLPGPAGKLHLALGMNGAAIGTHDIGLSSPAVNAAALKSPAALRCDDVSII